MGNNPINDFLHLFQCFFSPCNFLRGQIIRDYRPRLEIKRLGHVAAATTGRNCLSMNFGNLLIPFFCLIEFHYLATSSANTYNIPFSSHFFKPFKNSLDPLVKCTADINLPIWGTEPSENRKNLIVSRLR